MSLRPAALEDAAILFAWRYRDETAIGYPRHTTLADHKAWLAQRIASELVEVLIWEERGWPAGMIRIDSNGELAFHAETDDVAHNMLTTALPFAEVYGGRLKASLDEGDPKALQLERAGFDVYPSEFLVYRP